MSSSDQYQRLLIFILAFGLILRIAFIALHQRPLISDEKEYDALAYKIATTATYQYDGTPTAYRPIGYPAFVSIVYVVLGHHSIAVKLLQAIIDTVTALFLYFLLAGISERAGLVGATLWSIFVPAILYTNLLMSETIYTFLLVIFMFVLLREGLKSICRFGLLGLLLGIQILVKPGAAIIILICPFLFFRLGFSLKSFAAFTLVLLLTLAPWLIRNYSTFGQLNLTSNGGVNLLIGNNPHSTGAYSISFDQAILSNSHDEFTADHTALRYALRYIVDNPGTFIVNGAKKIARLFESEGGLLVLTFSDNPEDSTTHYATKYASIPPLLSVLTNIPYFAIFLGGIFGFVASKKDKLWWTVAVIMCSWLLLHAVFFGGGRFHFPVMPMAVMFAALFIANFKPVLRDFSASQWLISILASTGFIILWVYEAISILNA